MCCVFIILIAGCEIHTTPSSTAISETQVPASSATFTPTPNISLNPENFMTPTIASSPTLFSPEAKVVTHCLNIERKMPVDAVSSGMVILTKWGMFYTEDSVEAYSVNMLTGQRSQITVEEEIRANFFVSPGRNFYAYRYWLLEDLETGKINRKLAISDASGKVLRSIPWEKNWFGLIGWLDNQRLLIELTSANEDLMTLIKPSRQLVLDAFSGERRYLGLELLPPEWNGELVFHDWPVVTGWTDWLGAVYDPSLSMVVYPSIIEENTGRYTYNLWHVTEKRHVGNLEPIISGYAGTNYYPRPDWSPVGSNFAIVGGVVNTDSGDVTGRELFLVSRNGLIEQITHLGDSTYIWASSHSWSPDGRYIALYLIPVDGSNDGARLAVLDTETKILTDFCVVVHAQDDGLDRWPSAPIWSPDGKQLLLVDQYSVYYSQVIWVDIENGIAAQLADDSTAAGWMLLPSE